MSWFRNLSIRSKLIVIFAMINVLVVILGALSLKKIRDLKLDLDEIVEYRYKRVEHFYAWKMEVLLIGELLRNMVQVTEKADEYMTEIRRLQESVAERLKYIEGTIASEEEKKLFFDLKAKMDIYINEQEKQYSALKAGNKKVAIELLLTTVSNAQKDYLDSIDSNIASHKEQMEKAVKDADAVYKTALLLISAITVFIMLLAGVFTVILSKQIATPISKAMEVSQQIANGNLAVNIKSNSKDEIGKLMMTMENMVKNLKNIVIELKSSADTIASASNQLSTSSEQMSRGVAEQSGRASQIATSATEMSQSVIDIAKNASNIATAATDTAKIAKDGGEIVQRSVDEVKAIADTVNESAQMISSLGDRSRQIGEIISVIKDIADQTNLLALNAAIEAARAGEQGRGFAVVADEVRKLAERTAKATSEIGEMIKGIQDEVERAVTSMDKGTEKVQSGVEYSIKAGEALKKIVDSVEGLHGMVQQIASATEEMSTVSETISNDIETIANVSKETSSSTEQIAQSSSDLARLATKLTQIVGQFKV